MEEWEYLEGHKDLYKDVMMEDEADGSRKRNPPQRCPRPLDDLPIPRQDQSGDVGEDTVRVKEECKEEDEEYGVMEDLSDGQKDMMVPPQRCPRPLEDLLVPRQDQGEDLVGIKVEVKEEETLVRGHQSMKDGEIIEPVKEEESTDGSRKRNPPQRGPRPLEDLPIPCHHQSGDVGGCKTDIKEEDKEEDEVKGCSDMTMKPPERRPRPLENLLHDQCERGMKIKVEVKEEEEETRVMDYPQTMEKVGMTVTTKQEECSVDRNGSRKRNPPQRCPRPLEDLPIPRHDEQKYLEGHKDLYKDVVMEDEPDGSRKRNPPQRCPRPRDDLLISCHHQVGETEAYKNLYKDIMIEPPNDWNPPQRCPLEDLPIPHNNQGEDLVDVKVEVKEEETCVMDDRSMKQGEMRKPVKEEESTDGSRKRNPPQRCPRPQEDPTIARQDQSENLGGRNVVIKQEFIMADEEFGVIRNLDEELEDQSKNATLKKPRNPPQRCPCPQEDPTVPHHNQNENLGGRNVVIKQEFIMADGQYGVMNLSHGLEDRRRNATTEPPNNRNPPETCPRPLEDLPIPRQDQVDDEDDLEQAEVFDVKVECKEEEEMYEEADHRSTAELRMSTTVREEEDINQEDDDTEQDETFPAHSKEPQHATHRTVKEGDKTHSCECGKSYKSKAALIQHQRIQSTEKPFPCAKCGKRFSQKTKLDIHWRTHTGERPFACSECGKSFIDMTQLKAHQKFHTGEDLHTCPECGKQFSRKSQVVVHQRYHTDEYLRACSECGRKFPPSLLEVHLRCHTGEKPYQCAECGKRFIWNSQLIVHQRSHTGEKPFECSDCGLCFALKVRLQMHKKIHKEDKTHSCPECGKSFIWKCNLDVHLKRHRGEKPFSCAECGKEFVTKSVLNHHEKTHSCGNPVLCPVECARCGMRFPSRDQLVQHYNLHFEEEALGDVS